MVESMSGTMRGQPRLTKGMTPNLLTPCVIFRWLDDQLERDHETRTLAQAQQRKRKCLKDKPLFSTTACASKCSRDKASTRTQSRRRPTRPNLRPTRTTSSKQTSLFYLSGSRKLDSAILEIKLGLKWTTPGLGKVWKRILTTYDCVCDVGAQLLRVWGGSVLQGEGARQKLTQNFGNACRLHHFKVKLWNVRAKLTAHAQFKSGRV